MKYLYDNTSHNKAILSFRFLIYKTLSQSEFSLSCVGGVALSTLLYSHLCRVRFAESLVFCVVLCNLTKIRFSIFCRSLIFLFFFFFPFGHCMVCLSFVGLRFLISLFGIFKFFFNILYHFRVNTMFLASSYTAGINNRA